MIAVKLDEYLESLEERERLKSGARLQVPSIMDIADDSGVHYTTVNRIAKKRAKRLDFNTADKIIKAIRKRGFDMQLSDLIIYQDD